MAPSSLWRRLRFGNLALQAVGPLCGFVTVLVIARVGGAGPQGEFAQTKAWVELLVVIGCFGFPQSFIYVINRLGASARTLGRLSVAYGLAFIPIGSALTLAGLSLGWAHVAGTAGALWLLGLASGLFVVHGLWRGVFLTSGREMLFAVFSILAPVTLLLSVLGGLCWGQPAFPVLFALSGAASAGVGWALMRPVLRRGGAPEQPVSALPWRALLANGGHAFAQALLLVLQPLLAYVLIRAHGGTDSDIGLFNVGVFLAQGLSVPISMLAPLLFAQWTSNDDAARVVRLHAATRRWLVLDLLLGALAAACSLVLVPLVFGPGYGAAAPAVAVMLFVLPLTCHGRLIAPALHAHDRPAVNTMAGGIRLACLAAIAWAGLSWGGPLLTTVAGAWALSEVAATAWMLRVLKHLAGQQPRALAEAP